MTYTVTLGTSETGNILRIDNALDSIEKRLENSREQLGTAKSELGKPFPQEDELQEKLARLAELNAILDIDGNGVENADIAAEKKAAVNDKVSDRKPSILDRIKDIQKNEKNSSYFQEKSKKRNMKSADFLINHHNFYCVFNKIML